ncbi:MAG: HD domain-containing phosphohydrolase [Sandaracinaceae bacterium]
MSAHASITEQPDDDELEDVLPRILCVDDERNVLSGLERILFGAFDVTTASSGAEALALLDTAGPFAVVMSDMRMPKMSGAELLAECRARAPDTTRILLTGHAEVEAAIAAVNEGGIFRFLLKPCPHVALNRALSEAVEQHRLVTAERELLEHTLKGAIEVLTEVLAMASPAAFDRASHLRAYARHVVARLGWENPWMYEVAALLSQMGCITIPPDVLERAYSERELTGAEREMLVRHPNIAKQLLARIPRMEKVAAIVGSAAEPASGHDDEEVERGAELLRLALEIDRRVRRGHAMSSVIAALKDTKRHRALLLDAIASFDLGGELAEVVRAVRVRDLTTWMILDEDVRATNGSTLIRRGTQLSEVLLHRLANFAAGVGIEEPIRVRIPSRHA